MPLVNVMVNGKAYTLGCGEGEEPHLKELAGVVDAKMREALNMVGAQASDTKLLLTAALLLADEWHEARCRLDDTNETAGTLKNERDIMNDKAEAAENRAADILEAAAARVEQSLDAIAARVA
jgi:cell division protein ZapA